MVQLASYSHDLTHQFDAEARSACRAHRAPGRLAADCLAVAIVRAVEGEAPVAFLHLVTELHVEPFPANAAALGHAGHRGSHVP
jgi:hypothetical protein